ncbi:hypothetical protein GmRootV77_54650 [Variovorax sp. V77]
MAWLHTWSGLLVGWVLFMVFAAGTASYFKDEITFWMKPELHAVTPGAVPQPVAADNALAFMQRHAPDATRWFITLPTEREPGVSLLWAKPPPPAGSPPVDRRRSFDRAMLDPATGQAITAPRETRGGEFFYRLHFDLHYMPALWARWIVGFCAMFMLVAIVSGIVTHKRIFKDFFTFRPKKGQRSWLDAHNVTAVLALPYHAMITYTGLVTLMFMYMPWGPQVAYKAHGGNDTFFAEAFPGGVRTQIKASGTKAALAPLAPMVAQATAHWDGAPVGRIVVHQPNDANAVVSLTRAEGRHLSYDQPSMQFNGTTGALISSFGDVPKAAAETRGVLYGLHIGRFADPLLRALFFVSGLAGCLMVATGLLLWAVKERQKYAKTLKQGGRIGFGPAAGRRAESRCDRRPARGDGCLLLGQPPAAGRRGRPQRGRDPLVLHRLGRHRRAGPAAPDPAHVAGAACARRAAVRTAAGAQCLHRPRAAHRELAQRPEFGGGLRPRGDCARPGLGRCDLAGGAQAPQGAGCAQESRQAAADRTRSFGPGVVMPLLGLVFAASLAGFCALSLAMDRHSEDVFGRGHTPGAWRRWLQLGGTALLCLSLWASLEAAGGSVGWVLWLGALTAAALATVGLLSGLPHRFHWIASAAGGVAFLSLLFCL